MSEKVIGSIYPAALIGRTPFFGNVYMPYRLIFTTERVIAFYPDAKKAYRSGPRLFKALEYNGQKWKKLLEETGAEHMVFHGSEGVSDEMLDTSKEAGYGSLTYDKIGGVLLRPGEYEHEFNILFRPAKGKVLIRGLEFCTASLAKRQINDLLKKTPLSDRMESEI